VQIYALIQAGDTETIELYMSEDDAQQAVHGCLKDEPGWRGLLHVAAVELDAADSRN
jgi:hypothetical protein